MQVEDWGALALVGRMTTSSIQDAWRTTMRDMSKEINIHTGYLMALCGIRVNISREICVIRIHGALRRVVHKIT